MIGWIRAESDLLRAPTVFPSRKFGIKPLFSRAAGGDREDSERKEDFVEKEKGRFIRERKKMDPRFQGIWKLAVESMTEDPTKETDLSSRSAEVRVFLRIITNRLC